MRARHALAAGGRMMREGSSEGAFHCSSPVEGIDDFISHSWSGSKVDKVLTLLMYYNSTPGIVAGILVSAVTGILVDSVLVCALLAQAAFYAAIALWPSRRSVFLDKSCIPQDQAGKQDGIQSLGFILRNSTNMLCLWDKTYFTRLWCVFEYAVRLHLQDSDLPGRVTIMPTYYGFLTAFISACAGAYFQFSRLLRPADGHFLLENVITPFAALACCTLLFAHALVQRTKAFALQRQQMQAFSMSSARCTCCQLGHRDPESGNEIACDRVLIEEALRSWFGSTETFEDYVACHVSRNIPAGAIMLPYRYLALACFPHLQHGIIGYIKQGMARNTWWFHRDITYGAYETFLSGPMIWTIIFQVFACMTRGRVGHEMKARGVVLVSLACSLAVAGFFLVQSTVFVLGGGYVNYTGIAAMGVLNGAALGWAYRPRSLVERRGEIPKAEPSREDSGAFVGQEPGAAIGSPSAGDSIRSGPALSASHGIHGLPRPLSVSL